MNRILLIINKKTAVVARAKRLARKKAIGIGRKSKGQYTKAYNAINKIKKGLGERFIKRL